jgi:hypothetical protein
MRVLWSMLAVLGVGGIVTAWLHEPAAVVAEDPAKPAHVGADECKKCHLKHFKSWGKTGMAKTFEALKPNAAAEKKTKAGLDPAADFTKDAKCLKCHTTGYGTESGYPAPGEWTDEQKARATKMEGVSCEACHGPGSLYIPVKKANEKFKLEEIVKLGATTPPKAEQCLACHVKECPTMPADYAFDFEKAIKSPNVHEHVPLKHPH